MKFLLLPIIIYVFPVVCIAQSYLGISAGFDFAQIKEVGHEDGLWVVNKDFSTNSVFFAVEGDKRISEKLSISLNLSYTKKDLSVDSEILVWAPLRMRYAFYKGVLSGKWHFKDYFYAGTGLSFGYITDVKCCDSFNNWPSSIKNYKQYGVAVLAGLTYKGLFFEPSYLQGVSIGKKKEIDFSPINAFGLAFGYRLRVSKKKKRQVVGF